MVKICEGDLLSSGALFICHQVNCQGEMRSGVAKQIREKWPKVYEEYKKICDLVEDKSILLGIYTFCYMSSEDTVVINMFSQNRYGYDGKRYTNLRALKHCLCRVAADVPKGARIAMPYKIGCGLGGADWNVVYKMIEKAFENSEVELWKLPE